jgi:hypothetical protein
VVEEEDEIDGRIASFETVNTVFKLQDHLVVVPPTFIVYFNFKIAYKR